MIMDVGGLPQMCSSVSSDHCSRCMMSIYNSRTSLNWSYPVSNTILSCFSKTTDQNHMSRSQSIHRAENFDSSCTQNESLIPVTEPKGPDMTRTSSPEAFQKWWVCCPGRSGAETSYINGQVPRLSNQTPELELMNMYSPFLPIFSKFAPSLCWGRQNWGFPPVSLLSCLIIKPILSAK